MAKTKKIMANDILRIEAPNQYKLHLASRNDEGNHPLDLYVNNPPEWIGWHKWKGKKNDWTREYIFSLIEFYPRNDAWLFGGVFKVAGCTGNHYMIEKVSDFEKYEGRLVISFHRYQGLRLRATYLEKHINDFEVSEILTRPYSGESFHGYESINHDFNMVESIFKYERKDWKAALSSVKGVYLICDKSNGKMYVGSASGELGIWSRWACYIGTGHGWNDELTKLISEKGIDYARRNFKFSLLEITSMKTSYEFIIARESYWKSVLLTKEHGYNKN